MNDDARRQAAAEAGTLYVGIDAGGTSAKGIAQLGGAAPRRGYDGPAANAQRLGPDASARVLADVVARARADHPGARRAAVCAGVAGAGEADVADALHAALQARLGADVPLRIEHDATIALEGAHSGAAGMIVIAGTGSVVYGRSAAGTLARAGGWGYLLGDEGSGHALALAGLRAVADALDGGPPTALLDALADAHGISDRASLLRRVYRDDWALSRAAPLVVARAADGDAVCRRILTEQCEALAAQVERLCRRHPEVPARIALLGGMMAEDAFRACLCAAIAGVVPGATLRRPDADALEGALRLALTLRQPA